LTVDLRRLNRLLNLDKTSRLATLEAGLRGPQIENLLRKQGLTLGHFPQSFEYSSLGGWIATRSSGQQSDYYGKIENLFAGGHVESPAGPMDIPEIPASAAGPDLRQVILGSEGRLGVITQGTMRIRPIPEAEGFYGVFFRNWRAGVDAIRQFAQSDLPLSMVRLSDAQETETTLRLSEKEGLMKWADRGMRLLGYRAERSLLVFAVTGKPKEAARARDRAYTIAKKHGALIAASEMLGEEWRRKRFSVPYLRNTLWERGYALDTLETAVLWSEVQAATADIKKTISEASTRENRPVLVFSHISHVYPDGASIYVTYIYPCAEDPNETLEHWRVLKTAASETILAHGGTISHQHGVGRDHIPFLQKEKGEVGVSAIKALCEAFDPPGILNQGILLQRQNVQESDGTTR
jgi:alkyldihydroxyacetonephosphate synthase